MFKCHFACQISHVRSQVSKEFRKSLGCSKTQRKGAWKSLWCSKSQRDFDQRDFESKRLWTSKSVQTLLTSCCSPVTCPRAIRNCLCDLPKSRGGILNNTFLCFVTLCDAILCASCKNGTRALCWVVHLWKETYIRKRPILERDLYWKETYM